MEESNEHRGERALGGLAGGAVAARATKAAIATVETKATAEVSVAGLLTVPLFLGLDGIKRFSPASVAERLGADCHGAKQRAKRNFHKVACMMRAPSAGGPQKVLAIDLKYLPAFMLGFGCNQVRKEIGPRLDEIQEAMHTALSAYTFEGVGAHPHVAPARDPHPLFPRDDASGEQRDLGARGRPCGSFAPHPLFPRADKSPEDRDIKFVSFKRHDATGVVVSQCEEIPASEVTSWEQVFAWWGGGRYKAYGKDGMHRF